MDNRHLMPRDVDRHSNVRWTELTLDVTLYGETRAVRFRQWGEDDRADALHNPETDIAIAKGGGKVWPAQMLVWQNPDGSWFLHGRYTRLNRNAYTIRGWFNVVCPKADVPHLSQHNSR